MRTNSRWGNFVQGPESLDGRAFHLGRTSHAGGRSSATSKPGPVVAVDVGGTWIKSAVVVDNSLVTDSMTRCPTPHGEPDDIAALVDRIVNESKRLANTYGANRAGLSLAAAIDHTSGRILGSGPLWGGQHPRQHELIPAVRALTPDIQWTVLNDLTAQASGICDDLALIQANRVAVINVGTGIAMRSIVPRERRIDVDALGLQGEIGHLPAIGRLEASLDVRCDCGALGHVSSVSSGSAIKRVLALVADRGSSFLVSDEPLLESFAIAIKQRVPEALELLDAFTAPLARVIEYSFCIDPSLDRVLLTGGVVDAHGDAYLESIRGQCSVGVGPYQGEKAGSGTQIGRVAGEYELALRGVAFAAAFDSPSLAPTTLNTFEFTRNQVMQVEVGSDLTAEPQLSTLDTQLSKDGPILIIADSAREIQAALHNVRKSLADSGRVTTVLNIDVAKSPKNWAMVDSCLAAFEEIGVRRRPAQIVAMGGGTVLDAVGFAASQFRRGVPYIRIPTTLVGMIDAGLSLKVGVDRDGKRNRTGAFFPAVYSLIDPNLLSSLPEREQVSGLGECLKLALVGGDQSAFRLLRQFVGAIRFASPREDLVRLREEFVSEFARLTIAQLLDDPYEEHLERALDAGHTFSPIIETTTAFPHGHAVILDLALCAGLSHNRGHLSVGEFADLLELIRRIGVNSWPAQVELASLLGSLDEARSHRGGQQNVALFRGLAQRPVFVNDIEHGEMADALGLVSSALGGDH